MTESIAPPTVDVIGLDADDTLWHNESYFALAQATFAEVLAPWTDAGTDVLAAADATERRNLELFGYGIKGFTLSMVETALELSGQRISAEAIAAIIDLGKEMLAHPVELLDGVGDAIEAMTRRHRLVLITKGDLIHQEQKIARSGLADAFDRVEIVSEKDPATYAAVLGRAQVEAGRFLMVGNSVRSDILPVLDVGGHAAHVPYEITWSHEVVDDDPSHQFPVFASLTDVARWID